MDRHPTHRSAIAAALGVLLLATAARGATPTEFAADAFRQPDGPAIRFGISATDAEQSTPMLQRVAIRRATEVRVLAPRRGQRLGTLVFSLRDTAPRNTRTVVLRLGPSGRGRYVIANRTGARVTLSPGRLIMLDIALPAGAINPRLNLTGPGARLLRFTGCPDLVFAADWTLADGTLRRDTSRLPARRLRRAGLCDRRSDRALEGLPRAVVRLLRRRRRADQ